MKRKRVGMAKRKFSPDSATIFLEYGIDVPNRMIHIDTAIEPETAGVIIRGIQLMYSQSTDLPIKMFINSPGGDVASGFAIYDTIMTLPTNIVHTYCHYAASMACIVFLGGGMRYIYPLGELMAHSNAHTGIEGKTFHLSDEVDQMKWSYARFCDILERHSNKSAEFWKKHIKYHDRTFHAEEALDSELVDEIIQYTERE